MGNAENIKRGTNEKSKEIPSKEDIAKKVSRNERGEAALEKSLYKRSEKWTVSRGSTKAGTEAMDMEARGIKWSKKSCEITAGTTTTRQQKKPGEKPSFEQGIGLVGKIKF